MKTRVRMAIEYRLNLMRQELSYQLRRKPKRVLFDHLPKCAGTTLKHYLSAHYPDRLIFTIKGQYLQESVKEFHALPQESRFEYQLVMGHFAHELIDFVHPEILTVTVLREPIDRIVSHYFFVKRYKEHYLHERVVQSDLSLESYVSQRLSDELQNWYTTHFSGLTVAEVEEKPEEALQRAAKILLETYDIIGFQDEFAAVVEKLRNSAKLSWPYRNETLNKTHERSSLNEISEAAMNVIIETNSVDIKLFDLVKQKLG